MRALACAWGRDGYRRGSPGRSWQPEGSVRATLTRSSRRLLYLSQIARGIPRCLDRVEGVSLIRVLHSAIRVAPLEPFPVLRINKVPETELGELGEVI